MESNSASKAAPLPTRTLMLFGDGRFVDHTTHVVTGRGELLPRLEKGEYAATLAELRRFDAYRAKHPETNLTFSGYYSPTGFNMGLVGLSADADLMKRSIGRLQTCWKMASSGPRPDRRRDLSAAAPAECFTRRRDHRSPPELTPEVVTAPGSTTADIGHTCRRHGETGVPPLTNTIEGTAEAGFPEEIAPRPEDYVFLKRRPSAFYGTGVAELLHMLRRDTIIIGGGATNRGVETSVREAFNLDIASVVARECCWSSDAAAHAYSLDKAMKMYARIRSLDAVTAMLRG